MPDTFCTDTVNIWRLVGYFLMIFKIVIPIILIVLGMIDLGKAVVASKDDEIKKSVKSLVMRAIAGIVIFFIPTLVGAIFSLVGEFGSEEYQAEYKICSECITHPGDAECQAAVDKAS